MTAVFVYSNSLIVVLFHKLIKSSRIFIHLVNKMSLNIYAVINVRTSSTALYCSGTIAVDNIASVTWTISCLSII